MDTPQASIRTSWNEPPILGQATVKVYEMTPGQTQLQITWPDGATADTPEAAEKRVEFVRFIQSELETFLRD